MLKKHFYTEGSYFVFLINFLLIKFDLKTYLIQQLMPN
jgi:hypothetical protein